MKLGLKLLQERAKVGSFWWPYISNLPETYTVPIFFPGEDIKNLHYAPLLHQVFLQQYTKIKCIEFVLSYIVKLISNFGEIKDFFEKFSA